MTMKNRAWFLSEDGRAPHTLYVMYDNAINPSIVNFFYGRLIDLSGFSYNLSPNYDEKKINIDYLYKVNDKIVKFHIANTDEEQDKELETWDVTCTILGAIKNNHQRIILIKSDIQGEANLLLNSSNKDKIKAFIFNVSDNKWAKPEHILKWDFLPNSTAIPLANERTVALLEKIAPGQFQALPTEIRMPDGSIIKDYKLINATHSISAIDYSKCTIKEERFRTEANKYKDYWYKKDCLGDQLHIAIEEYTLIFLGSEILRKAIKNASLSGLTFKESYGGIHKFVEEIE